MDGFGDAAHYIPIISKVLLVDFKFASRPAKTEEQLVGPPAEVLQRLVADLTQQEFLTHDLKGTRRRRAFRVGCAKFKCLSGIFKKSILHRHMVGRFLYNYVHI